MKYLNKSFIRKVVLMQTNDIDYITLGVALWTSIIATIGLVIASIYIIHKNM